MSEQFTIKDDPKMLYNFYEQRCSGDACTVFSVNEDQIKDGT